VQLRQLSLVVFLTLCVMGTVQAAYCYPRLPERIASHFGFDGKPDGWSTKQSFLVFYGVEMGTSALLLGVALLFRFVPSSMLNIPNKDFWLSPQRRQETLASLFYSFLWFASATLLLLIDLADQMFDVNMGKADALPHSMLSLGLYFAFVAIWAVSLIVRFARKPSTDGN
jgi:uncharacterized membrane protein